MRVTSLSVSTEIAGGADGEFVGDALVVGGAHAGGGNAEAEERGVEPGELGLDGGEIARIGAGDLADFWMLLGDGIAADEKDGFDIGVAEAFAENALADHAGSAEENDAHGWMVARGFAAIPLL